MQAVFSFSRYRRSRSLGAPHHSAQGATVRHDHRNDDLRQSSAGNARPLVLFAVSTLICACGGEGANRSVNNIVDNSSPPQFVTAPTLVRLPDDTETLVHFTTNVPTKAHYELGKLWTLQSQEFSRTHYQMLPIATPNSREYPSLNIIVATNAGNKIQHQLPIPQDSVAAEAAATPSYLPPFGSLLDWNQDTSHPPVTLMSFAYTSSPTAVPGEAAALRDGAPVGLLQAYDQRGNVLWRYQHDSVIEQVVRAGPNSLTLLTADGLLSLDPLGSPQGWVGGSAQLAPELELSERIVIASQLAGVQRIQRKVLGLSDGHSLVLADIASPNPVVLELNVSGGLVAHWDLAKLLNVDQMADADVSFALAPSDMAFDPRTQTIVLTLPALNSVVALDRNAPRIAWLQTNVPELVEDMSGVLLQETGETPAGGTAMPALAATSVGFAGNGDLILINRSMEEPSKATPAATEPLLNRLTRWQVDAANRTYQVVASNNVHSTNSADRADQIAKQHGVFDASAPAFWVLNRSGRQLSKVEWTLPLPSLQNVLSIQQPSDTGSQSQPQWRITDAIALDRWFGAQGFDLAAQRLGLSLEKQTTAKVASNTRAVSFHGLSLQPDLTVAGIDLSGSWDITMGDAALAKPHRLNLIQTDAVIAGDLSGQSLTAFVRGNTFSTTFRIGFGQEQTKFKYRGLIDSGESYMEGHVGLYRNDRLLDVTTWQARKR